MESKNIMLESKAEQIQYLEELNFSVSEIEMYLSTPPERKEEKDDCLIIESKLNIYADI